MIPRVYPDSGTIILHIDDEQSQLHFTKTFLENENQTFHVISILDFEELIERLSEPYDLILSDYKMPKYDGIQICKIVKEIEEKPFILYTAHGSEEVAEKAYETGVDDYIRKEINPSHYKVLAKRIQQAVEKHRSEQIQNDYKNRLEALHTYATEIASADNLEKIAELSFEAIKKTLEFSYASFHILEGNNLVEIFTMGVELVEPFIQSLDGPGVNIRAVNQGKTQIVPDTRVDEDYTAWQDDLVLLSEVAVPFKINGEVVGVFNVESEHLNAFTGEDVRLLETLVTHVSSAYNRIQKMETIRGEEKKWRNLLESSMEAAFVIVGTEIEYANKMASDLAGYDDPSQLIGVNALDLVTLKDRDLVKNRMSSRQRGEKQPHQYEFTLLKKDGSELHVETNASFINFEGKPASLSYCRDISERKEFENKFLALHKSSYRLGLAENTDTIFEIMLNTLNLVFGFEFAGIALVHNDSLKYAKTFGIKIQEDWEIPLNSTSIMARAYRKRKPQNIPDIRLDPDYLKIPRINKEKFITKSELAVPIFIENEIIGIINIESEKIDAFSEYEVKLVETLAFHSAAALQKLNQRSYLEKLVEEKSRELIEAERFVNLGKITSMVSNDLRNPLQVISNAVHFLEDNGEGHLERIKNSITFAEQLLEEIKLDTAFGPLVYIDTDIKDLVYITVEQIERPRNIKLQIDIDTEINSVYLDPLKIQRVLLNLVKNSYEAMPDGGILSINVHDDDKNLYIEISDTGCGIPDEVQSELFSSVITTKLYGTGLGLPFCKKVIDEHGGHIKIKSDVSEGTTVSISIPMTNNLMIESVDIAIEQMPEKLNEP